MNKGMWRCWWEVLARAAELPKADFPQLSPDSPGWGRRWMDVGISWQKLIQKYPQLLEPGEKLKTRTIIVLRAPHQGRERWELSSWQWGQRVHLQSQFSPWTKSFRKSQICSKQVFGKQFSSSPCNVWPVSAPAVSSVVCTPLTDILHLIPMVIQAKPKHGIANGRLN